MYAEALNEISFSASGEAFQYLNKVRQRAGIQMYTDQEINNQSAFRDAILRERRFEFAFENHRWFDLLRTGKVLKIMNASANGEFTVKNYQLVFPIPQSQIDAAPDKMVQNAEY